MSSYKAFELDLIIDSLWQNGPFLLVLSIKHVYVKLLSRVA